MRKRKTNSIYKPHCDHGPGPSQTGWIELIRNWVEKGITLERVILSKSADEKV